MIKYEKYNGSLSSAQEIWNFACSLEKTVVIKFYADWCNFCKKIDKTFSLLKIKEEVLVLEIDIDKFFSVAKDPIFSVKTIPSIFIFKNKKIFFKLEDSSLSSEELERLLKT